MPRLSWKIKIALILSGLTVVLTLLHIALFNDPRTLFFYLALDIVFVPVQVLLVSIVIEQLLSERETQNKRRKLNMVIGAFMGELGTRLLGDINRLRVAAQTFDAVLNIDGSWKQNEYRQARQQVAASHLLFTSTADDLEALRILLLQQRNFVLGLLQNANTLEHEAFSDLLLAVCHLTEELEYRGDFSALPESDHQHLHGDILRAYGLLVQQWISYMQHLQGDYPYIFSLSVRTSPFNPNASAIVL
jgi:hypothetical protein